MTKFIPGGPARYAHQRKGLRKILATNGVAALLFDPGTGKTATALDFASILAIKNGGAKVLVIAPLAAIDTWVDQAQTWVSPQVSFTAEALGGSITQRREALAARGGRPLKGTKPGRNTPLAVAHRGRALAYAERIEPGLPLLEIVSVNTDMLASRAEVGSMTVADKVLDAVKRYDPDLVIVDESHRIKGNNGNASRLLHRIGRHVKHRLILTGTVMPHSPLDVYAQWRFLNPEAFGRNGAEATWSDFHAQFAVLGGWMGKEVIRFENLDKMQDIMAINALAVTKADALDLPPTTDTTVWVNLNPAERKAYAELKADLTTNLDLDETATVPNRLTQMLRLRQVTSGHLPTDSGDVATLGASKVDTIVSIAHDNLAGQQRLVVFCYFTHEVHALAAALARKDTVVEVITGETANAERIAIRKRFGDLAAHPERTILVAQIKTISLAVNELVTASNAIFGSLSQQRDDWTQARDRLHRIGQVRPVTFWYAVVRGTVDEVILNAHQNRLDLETQMLRYLKETA